MAVKNFQDVNEMASTKRNKLNMTAASKILVIMVLDVLATSISFFFGLWFRYDFVFADIRQVHLEGFLSAIGPWCAITLLVLLVFKLYNCIWASSVLRKCSESSALIWCWLWQVWHCSTLTA